MDDQDEFAPELEFDATGHRDPARIDRVLGLLAEQWKKHPDYRLGQLVCILAGGADEVYATYDHVIERRLRSLLDEAAPR